MELITPRLVSMSGPESHPIPAAPARCVATGDGLAHTLHSPVICLPAGGRSGLLRTQMFRVDGAWKRSDIDCAIGLVWPQPN